MPGTYWKRLIYPLVNNVSVTVENGVIIISPVKNVRGRYNLEELVSRIPEDYQAVEVDWGKPAGKEAW